MTSGPLQPVRLVLQFGPPGQIGMTSIWPALPIILFPGVLQCITRTFPS